MDAFGVTIVAGETLVTDGRFTVMVIQPTGQSFSGKTVSFAVDGKAAGQSGTWQAGAADIINLYAN